MAKSKSSDDVKRFKTVVLAAHHAIYLKDSDGKDVLIQGDGKTEYAVDSEVAEQPERDGWLMK